MFSPLPRSLLGSLQLSSARLSWPVSSTLPFSPFIYSPHPLPHSMPFSLSLFSCFLSSSSSHISHLTQDMAKVKWVRRRRRRRQEGVERRMKKLQRLVPGGAGTKPEQLFLKTAEHILQLRLQLNVLQALSKIFSMPDD